MELEWRVRAATAGDVDAVVELERGIPELPHWAAAEYATYALQESAAGHRRLLLAETMDGELVGVAAAAVRPAPMNVIEVESLGVAARSRRMGVARRLCEELLMWGRRLGAATAELEVRSRSEGAIALYASLGFIAMGQRRGYYDDPPDDAVLMSMRLAEPLSEL